MNLTWKEVFNSSLKHHGFIGNAVQQALSSGYQYIAWNGRVYFIAGFNTEEVCLESEVK